MIGASDEMAKTATRTRMMVRWINKISFGVEFESELLHGPNPGSQRYRRSKTTYSPSMTRPSRGRRAA
jgi:hypothetical protein